MWHRDASPSIINSFLDALIARFVELNLDVNTESEEQIEVRQKISDFIRKYAFISQIITFTDTSLEAMYIFLRYYRKKLPVTKNILPAELLELVNLESIKIPKTGETAIKLDNEVGNMEPMTGSGRGGKKEDDIDALSRIIDDVNKNFGTTFSEEDRVMLNNLSRRLLKNDVLA